jgi:aminomethyltransferase
MLDEYFEARGIALARLGEQRVPLRFSSATEEHLATRRIAGLFDFSFMGCFEVTGREALRFLDFLQTRNLTSLREGRAYYTLLCNEDGAVINDATVWRHCLQQFWLFTGRREDWRHIAAVASGFAVTLTDLSGKFAIIAVQGPRSQRILKQRLDSPLPEAYFSFSRAIICGENAWVARLGYTGECGFELLVPSAAGAKVWKALLAADNGIRECGFEAADSLRIEAGYVLFTCELAKPATPYELGLGRLVALPRSPFLGSGALQTIRFRRPARTLAGLRFGAVNRKWHDGNLPCVEVTSQCDSPIFGKTLGLGFVTNAQRFPGSLVYTADGRVASVSRLPFYDPPRVVPRRSPVNGVPAFN